MPGIDREIRSLLIKKQPALFIRHGSDIRAISKENIEGVILVADDLAIKEKRIKGDGFETLDQLCREGNWLAFLVITHKIAGLCLFNLTAMPVEFGLQKVAVIFNQ